MMLRNVGYEKEIDNHKEVETVVADKKRIQLPIPPAIQNNHSRGVSKKAAISASIVVVLVMTIFFLTVISGGGDFGASALPFFTLLGGLIWIVIFFIARIVLNIKTELGDSEQETVARVLPWNVNSKKKYRWLIPGIVLLVPISIWLLTAIFDPTANKDETVANASNSQTGNSSNLKNSIGIELVNIPAGSFMMGSENEKPVHKVTISTPFLMGKYEVTQEQWQSVMGTNPSKFSDCPKCPVEQVSWDDAQSFIGKLNGKSDGYQYRLPTEAEWEYACRAGTTGDYYDDLDSIAWYNNNSGSKTHPAGGKKANAFGLYDMSGNVWEWCQDWYAKYSSGEVTDPTGARSGQYRVLRGGSWNLNAYLSRSAGRGTYNLGPSVRHDDLGFRVAARPK